jgi:hypothetical protein
MTTYVMRGGELVDIRDAEPLHPRSGRGPIILGDSMPDANGRDVLNHADGKYYSSKSQYYAATKRAGVEITGSDYKETPPIRQRYKPKGVGADVKKAIAQLRSR